MSQKSDASSRVLKFSGRNRYKSPWSSPSLCSDPPCLDFAQEIPDGQDRNPIFRLEWSLSEEYHDPPAHGFEFRERLKALEVPW